MSVQNIKSRLPDYAKDTKLNLSTVLTEEGAEGLTQKQIDGIALSAAYATKNQAVIQALTIELEGRLSAEEINAAKAAATIMGMNNVYYRFTHMVRDKDYLGMPAKLRMNVIGRPGIEKADFELYSLAVSAINGCGMCIEAHVNEVVKAGVSKVGVQSTIRIAAVINAAAQAIVIEDYS
ncbi:carboxymuconolactone decarboxylase family protein [Emcibacter sp.]|uniref:carboxymuconolactone decarboxylase family protein n=1 Tax=Emcibacter sp. TaxID=1979954 RepID=UPI002AA897D8|nr:carboxymuconolactone decarboxylase family protein [Emcibacter sp.]